MTLFLLITLLKAAEKQNGKDDFDITVLNNDDFTQ